MSERIAVLGAGSWGIAIADCLADNGHRVTLWEFNRTDYDLLVAGRAHPSKLPGVTIPEQTVITNDLAEAVEKSSLLVLAIPAQKIRTVCEQLRSLLRKPIPCVNLAKGVEMKSLKRMSEVITEVMPVLDDAHVATLSGPSHAEEVARRLPTSVVAASIDLGLAEHIQHIFSNAYFRVYR